jgi:hypothetical protein
MVETLYQKAVKHVAREYLVYGEAKAKEQCLVYLVNLGLDKDKLLQDAKELV